MDLQKYGWRKKQQRERERDAGQKWMMTYGKIGEVTGKQGVDKLNWGAKTETNRKKDLINIEETLSWGTEKGEQENMLKEENEKISGYWGI